MDQHSFFGSFEPHPDPLPDTLPDPPRDAPAVARTTPPEDRAMPADHRDAIVQRQAAFVERRSTFVERQDGAWRVLPIEGRFELVYEDGNGAWSVRRLQAHELKIGPGRVLVGGTDRDRDGYRGFRADRIHRLTDRDTGERVERNILDWLTRRAEAARRARAAALRQKTLPEAARPAGKARAA
ncbi:hypothetical protein mvi_24970 [Methylobacterium indicum]|uniref:Uncharacterized protein n=2 Tax=Methylobacterium indicum TaxID=1775910 RepID=A0A8H9C6R6_9HYPH|nr:hypothetical protein mvi_24970 [Methylobacterium indicum]